MKKIAVVNRTNLLNYGSVLQVLALAEVIKTLGYETEVIWEEGSVSKHLDLRPGKIISICLKLIKYPKFIIETYRDLKSANVELFSDITKHLFRDFVDKNFNRKFYTAKDIKRIGRSTSYHKYVCGSDQVWCSTTLYPDPLMYLRFTDKEKRVAYAPSLGRSYIPNYNKKKLKKYISDIPFVSIRETEGSKLLRSLIGKDFPVVLDPTLLFDSNFWMKYSNPSINEKGFILCYFLSEPGENIQKEIAKYAAGKHIIVLKSSLKWLSSNYKDISHPNAGPSEFISYISCTDFIYTDSYHGMLFSINFEKEFLSVERNYGKYNQSTRQISILEQLGIDDHYSYNGVASKEFINYQKVKIKLESLRKASYSFLKNALD